MFPICYKKQTKDIAHRIVYFAAVTNTTSSGGHFDEKLINGPQPARHLDQGRAALSRGAVERPLYFAFALAFVFCPCPISRRQSQFGDRFSPAPPRFQPLSVITTCRLASCSTASHLIEMPTPGSSPGLISPCLATGMFRSSRSNGSAPDSGGITSTPSTLGESARQMDMERPEDVREHGLPCSCGKTDRLDRARNSTYGGGIETKDIDPAYQIGDRVPSEDVFAGCDWRNHVLPQLMGKAPIRRGKGIFKKVQPQSIEAAAGPLRLVQARSNSNEHRLQPAPASAPSQPTHTSDRSPGNRPSA